jgi:hypothetical protein
VITAIGHLPNQNELPGKDKIPPLIEAGFLFIGWFQGVAMVIRRGWKLYDVFSYLVLI